MTPSVMANSLTVITFAGALFLVNLLHISVYTCEAKPRTYFSQRGDSGGGRSSEPVTRARDLQQANSSSSAAPYGVTYRPPIINFSYDGGRIMWKPIHVYFVWYGSWSEAEKNLVRVATKSLTPTNPIPQWPNLSNLYKLVTKYYQELPGDSGRTYASNNVTIAGEVVDQYSHGHILDPGALAQADLIQSHLGQGLPFDYEQGIYFVFTSGDVTFQNSMPGCGYHYFSCNKTSANQCTDSHNNFIFAFIPLASEANGLLTGGCSLFATATSPGLPVNLAPNKQISSTGALDTLVDIYLHELLETIVDPYQTAWLELHNGNMETADLCSFTFAAGDWWYCDMSDIYPDFPEANQRPGCHSFPNLHTLVDPASNSAFNQYGVGGSKFLVQKFWNLATKGCATQPEEPCPAATVVLQNSVGTIQRGLFIGGVGLQAYAPGQNCNWKILVPGARSITLTFEEVALGYDDLDFVTVASNYTVWKKVTGFGKNITLTLLEEEADIGFITYDRRSPYPDAAGFILNYSAGY